MDAHPPKDALTAVTAAMALQVVCEKVGLDPVGARLLRLGENAIFALPEGDLVVRIARSEENRERVEREVAVAAWLADLGFPSVLVARDVPQVVPADGRLVTFWELVTESGVEPTTGDLGRVLADFHALPPPPFSLPVFDPFSAVPARLAQAGDADPADVEFLADRYEQLTAAYQALIFPGPPGLIHGDAHRGNLLVTDSAILLSDFEVVASGPREWDLTPTALSVDRFGLPRKEYDEFVQAYGRDVTEWSGFPTMAAMRELTMTTWLMQNISESRQILDEFRVRVNSMREGDHARRWSVY